MCNQTLVLENLGKFYERYLKAWARNSSWNAEAEKHMSFSSSLLNGSGREERIRMGKDSATLKDLMGSATPSSFIGPRVNVAFIRKLLPAPKQSKHQVI